MASYGCTGGGLRSPSFFRDCPGKPEPIFPKIGEQIEKACRGWQHNFQSDFLLGALIAEAMRVWADQTEMTLLLPIQLRACALSVLNVVAKR